MNKYFYNLDGQNIGPLTLNEIQEKKLKPDDYVWRDDMENWTQAKFLDELIGYLSIIPPKLEIISPPKLEISNKEVNKNNDNITNKISSKKSNIILIALIFLLIFNLLVLPFSCYDYGCYNGFSSIFDEHNPTILPIIFFNIIALIILFLKKLDKTIATLIVVVEIITLILLFLNYYWIYNEGNNRGFGLYGAIICTTLIIVYIPKILKINKL